MDTAEIQKIDSFFDDEREKESVTIAKASSLITGAISKAAESADKDEITDRMKRVFVFIESLTKSVDEDNGDDTISIDKSILDAVEEDAKEASPLTDGISDTLKTITKSMGIEVTKTDNESTEELIEKNNGDKQVSWVDFSSEDVSDDWGEDPASIRS